MSEMIERVAKAICREQCAFMGEPPCWQADGLSPDCDEPGCLALAEAAIVAMRDPTEEMAEAASSARNPWDTILENSVRTWQAMIDAALAEAEGEKNA